MKSKTILFLSFILLFILFSCKENKKPITLSNEIKAFSVFQHYNNSRGENFFINLYLLDSNRITKLNLNHDIQKTYTILLDSSNFSRTKLLLDSVKFKSFIGNHMHEDARKTFLMYCGDNFGFIDSTGKAEVYFPPGNIKGDESYKLTEYLETLKWDSCNNNSKAFEYYKLIKQTYLKKSPPIPGIDSLEALRLSKSK
jgi:hypothetical protein